MTHEERTKIWAVWAQSMENILGRKIITREDAQQLGLKRFFPGRACSRGHYSERFLSSGGCVECKKPPATAKKARLAIDWTDKLELRKYHRAYRAKFPEKVATFRRNRRARKISAPGSHSAQQIASLLIKQRNRCLNCLKTLTKGYHVDHIIPLVRGGTNDIKNIQILCPSCNCRKQAKDPIKWANEHGRLL